MSALTAFHFESQPLRVVRDADGEPWFVAADVCAALHLPETHKAVMRLDDDEKGRNSIPTPGGEQEMTVVNEAGLYSLVLGSRKPEAKRFKRWVTHEVLPTIRKTGSYAAPGSVSTLPSATQDKVSALLLIGEAVTRVPGVKAGIAMAATLTSIQDNTGLVLEAIRRALPTLEAPAPAMNPTQLGQALGGLAARTVNLRLEALGLQYHNDRNEWALTAAGEALGQAFPFSRHGHSGYQILWRPEVIEQIREVA